MDLTLMKPLESHEITQVIEKASLFGGRIAQLGAIENQQTIITKIEMTNEGKVLLTVQRGHGLEQSHPISVNLAYRNMVFRADPHEFNIMEDTIICHIPFAAKALDQRLTERFILPFKSEVSAFLHRIEKRNFDNDIKVKIVDVSKLGLGLHVHGITLGTICKYDHIWIRTINDVALADPIFGKIQYVSERKFQNNVGDMRIGLALDKQLPEEIFQELVKKCSLVLSA